MRVDLVVSGATELLTFAGGEGPLVGDDLGRVELVRDGACIVSGGKIEWVGPTGELESALGGRQPDYRLDASGQVVMPGFVDCHTHIPFARGRQAEFEMRIEGKTYLEIAAAGGGIQSSVRHFREAPTETLVEWNLGRLRKMLACGSTTVECKTGYGLSTQHELRGLEIIDRLAGLGPWRLVPTFLGAHTVPAEYRERRSSYVDLLVEETIPAVAEQGIARYCDIFIEEGAYTVEEGRRILQAALDAGLDLKLHVDEFHALGGSALAAELAAVSADHLEAIPAREMALLARQGVVGVLMPGVNYFLGSAHYAPARDLARAGVPIALATDFNPGSCMCHSMEMVLSVACTHLRLLPGEVLAAATRNAAYACGIGERVGRIQPGFEGDLIVLDVDDHRTIPYHFGASHVTTVVVGGRVVAG